MSKFVSNSFRSKKAGPGIVLLQHVDVRSTHHPPSFLTKPKQVLRRRLPDYVGVFDSSRTARVIGWVTSRGICLSQSWGKKPLV